ncbi:MULTISPECIES: hypothetical protein [unclassified Streptomyces]|uniref:hypothetical protein n=1 Tax=unclassified Streptomyces TaxID=2593676 RepID=UPI0033C8571B
MFALLLVLILVLFGLGFLDPVSWAAATGPTSGTTGSMSGAGIVRTAGTAATPAGTERAGGARNGATANAAGDPR